MRSWKLRWLAILVEESGENVNHCSRSVLSHLFLTRNEVCRSYFGFVDSSYSSYVEAINCAIHTHGKSDFSKGDSSLQSSEQ